MRTKGLAENAPHADITAKIIGLAIKVRDDLGPGHREEVYHNALRARFDGVLDYMDEPELFVRDALGNDIFLYKPDFIVADAVIVELKAHTSPLTNSEIAQVFDYFAASDYVVALLINFGKDRLGWKRLFPPKKILRHRERRKPD